MYLSTSEVSLKARLNSLVFLKPPRDGSCKVSDLFKSIQKNSRKRKIKTARQNSFQNGKQYYGGCYRDQGWGGYLLWKNARKQLLIRFWYRIYRSSIGKLMYRRYSALDFASPILTIHWPHKLTTYMYRCYSTLLPVLLFVFQIRFWYRMYGSSIGKLMIYQRYSTLDFPSPILVISGSQGDSWKRAIETIDIEAKFQVRKRKEHPP